MAKKTGYTVVSYDEDKSGLRTNATKVHINEIPEYIVQLFEENSNIRQFAIWYAPNWNSFTKRVHVYTKKGR